MYYFAYGSNINLEHFNIFCPNAVKSCQHAILFNHKVELHTIPSCPHGKAFTTLTESHRHHVHGVLYNIEHLAEERNLNKKEGLHLQWYEKKDVSIVLNNNPEHEIKCKTYVMLNGIRELNIPSNRYADIFREDHENLISSCSLTPPLSRNTRCSVLSL